MDDMSTKPAAPEAKPGEETTRERRVGSPCSDLRDEQPALYGRLLSVNERLSRTGRMTTFVLITIWALTCIAIMAEVVPTILGFHTEDLQHIGCYLLIGVILWALYFRIQDVRRTREYKRWRDDLASDTRYAKFDQARLIAAMEGDDAAGLVMAEIKADPEFDGRRR